MRALAEPTGACALALLLGGCAVAPSLGASVAMWAATRGAELYFLRESPAALVRASRSRVAAAVADVLGSLDIERAAASLAGGEPYIIEAVLSVQGEVLITLVPLGADVTKVTVSARTTGLIPDIEVAKEVLGRIVRALEGPPQLSRQKVVI